MTVLPHEKQIAEYQETIEKVKKQNQSNPLWSQEEIDKLEDKLQKLKDEVYGNLTVWNRITICRHPDRPHTSDYIQNICDQFVEIHGDRSFQDDPAIITGLGIIEGKKFVIIGLEKGKDTEKRLHRNFGMAHPEGYRKALRAMKLAEKFHLPIISFIDTPGAYPGLTAEERGQGWAIARNLFEMASLRTPIIVVLIGEGCSGGALGIGVGDVVGMLEHSYYSVISPEGCASILWNEAEKNAEAAESLKMQAEDLLKWKIIDEIIIEPQGGAHKDPQSIYNSVKRFVLKKWQVLQKLPYEELIEKRYLKFRKMGKFANISI